MISGESLLKSISIVVAALDQRLASDVVLHVLLGRVESAVITATRSRVNETAGDALDEKRVVDLELNSVLELLLALLEHFVETLGLGDSAREPIEDEAIRKRTR